jgi:hypothetical protein
MHLKPALPHRLLIEEPAAISTKLLQERELIPWAAGLAEMRRAIHVWRHLVTDELCHLGVFVPGLRHPQILVVLRLVRRPQLRVLDNVLAVIQRQHVAVVEESPALPFVDWQELEKRMIILQIRLVHVLGNVVVDRRNHPAIGQRRNPGRSISMISYAPDCAICSAIGSEY